MEKIFVKPRAKVNLTLSILEKRADGYHNLESVFQKINLYDEMWIEKTDTDFIEIDSNIKNVKLEDNIIFKAYKILKEKFPFLTGVKVTLNKKIPMQAGLAGGSTDGAYFLKAMKKLFELDMSNTELEDIACRLGADVVPCMYDGVIKAEGIGDIITNTKVYFKYYIVILKPNIFCSTKDMYDKLDSRNFLTERKTDKMLEALGEKDAKKLAKNLYNDFEEVSKDIKEIVEAKEKLKENGAMGTLLAGSGSAVFGVFENKETAKKAYYNLRDNYEAYICTSYIKKEK